MRRARNVRPGRRRWWIACLLLAAARPSGASPDAFLPVRDPLQDELRILDTTDPGPGPGRIVLPHLNTLPLQWRELEGAGPPADSTDPARAISLARIERALGRYAMPGFAPHPAYRSTPFTWQASAASQALDLSLGLEGRGEVDRVESRYTSGSGAQARLAASVGGWLVYTHLLVGQVDQARTFADPLIPNSDVIL
ncbi:MAG TPA: hypothetical protein VI792_11770, partial [Candidatus Eisenbacteria bacterium]